MATYSGFTENTADRLIIDAGAFYKNYDVDTETPETASAKLLGATRGGGEFSAIPELRVIEADGVKGRAKNLVALDSWEVTITANMLELTAELMKLSLAGAEITSAISATPTYDEIRGKNTIVSNDYIDNITWIGRLSGSSKPVIIQVFNALATNGFVLTTADKAEGVVPITFTGHYVASNLDNPPFAIYYPKAEEDEG